VILAGFIAATGICWVVMFADIVDVFRNYLYRIDWMRKMLMCSLCTGFWSGMLVRFEPAFNYWWFPFGAAAVAWVSTLALYRLTGIDPSADTGRTGERYTRRWAIGAYDFVEVLEANRFFVRFRDAEAPLAIDAFGRVRSRVRTRFSFDDTYISRHPHLEVSRPPQ
jgi:hypothetical protein